MDKEKIDKIVERNSFSLEDMQDDNFNKVKDDFENFEKSVLNSPLILQHATKEELATFDLITRLPKKDIQQMLHNMADILSEKDNISNEEYDMILKMNRSFLKLLMIERWLERLKANN